MTSEVVDSITFACVHCLAELEIPNSGWDGWLRCGSCGRAFLPPEFERLRQKSRASEQLGAESGMSQDAGSPNGATGFALPLQGPERYSHTTPARLIFTIGFVLCLLLTLIKFLDFSPLAMTVFGALTLAFFLLLMRSPRKRLPTTSATWARQESHPIPEDNSEPMSNS